MIEHIALNTARVGRHLQRLTALEQQSGITQQPGCVVIYDSATEQPLSPIPEGMLVQVWLPAKREAVHDATSGAPAEQT